MRHGITDRSWNGQGPPIRALFWNLVVATVVLAVASCTTAPRPARLVPETAAPLDTNARDLAMLDRIAWGTNTPDAQEMAQQGGASSYLARQLRPPKDDRLPSAAREQIDDLSVTHKSLVAINDDLRALRDAVKATADKSDAHIAAQKALQQHLSDLARDAATRSLLRDLYSRNQLKEQLTWFWFNHFNVSQNKGDLRAYVGDYEDVAIRPHVLGHFRDLLAATLHHPAMLIYLDNAQNAAGHINENYAREIMELHTLGVDAGYTQKDVQELARILTGVGVNTSGNTPKIKPQLSSQYVRDGLFEFNPNRHDYGDKIFLGHAIKGEGLREVDEAIDILSAEPQTAHFISKKLATYFCCDTPSDALIGSMAATFERSNGDIAAVLQTLFASGEFQASLGHKFKDPFHFAISALRVTYGDTVLVNPAPLAGWLARMAEPLYGRETPDGYPMTEAAWAGPGEMDTRFEIARAIGAGHTGLFKLPGSKDPEALPNPKIADTRYASATEPDLSAQTRLALGQAKAPADWNMLLLSSPEFMHR